MKKVLKMVSIDFMDDYPGIYLDWLVAVSGTDYYDELTDQYKEIDTTNLLIALDKSGNDFEDPDVIGELHALGEKRAAIAAKQLRRLRGIVEEQYEGPTDDELELQSFNRTEAAAINAEFHD